MTDLLDEFGRPTWLDFSVIATRLLFAALLGAAIGFEREWRNRPAGLRTHVLVCVAAATFAVLAIEIVHAPVFDREGIRTDPLRLVEAVTAGVAFLAAGTIVLTRGQVHGLTTGAGMWLAGAVGLACGLGLWQIAAFCTGLVVAVLSLLQVLTRKLELVKETQEPAARDRQDDT
ncbi:MgtC/SapB family protein [Reyranella sp.]|uniref:MgtC/SapB family protein n=1 Tax=Reyranella sp. TaxID=1929291 RepID=UPI003BA91F11